MTPARTRRTGTPGEESALDDPGHRMKSGPVTRERELSSRGQQLFACILMKAGPFRPLEAAQRTALERAGRAGTHTPARARAAARGG